MSGVTFSPREYMLRLEDARKLMMARGLDCLFISGEENYIYFTGAKSVAPWQSFTRPVFAVIPRDEEATVITHRSLLGETRKLSAIKDVRSYSSREVSLGESPVKLLAEVFREKRLDKGRIGAELGFEQRLGFPYMDFQKLMGELPEARFVDASDVLWRLRIIKSSEEIDRIRKAYEITGKARQRCFMDVEEGMTEKDVTRLFFRYMLEEGTERHGFIHIISGTLSESTRRPTEKRLRRGETLYIDGGCYIQDYTCDYCRIAVIGEPSTKQKRLHKLIRETNRKMIEMYNPGTKVSEIAKLCGRS